MIEEKALLNVDETCKYLGLGDTMTRQLMRKEYFGFALAVGCIPVKSCWISGFWSRQRKNIRIVCGAAVVALLNLEGTEKWEKI